LLFYFFAGPNRNEISICMASRSLAATFQPRGTYPHNSLWEIKCYVIESLLPQMAHDQLHFGLRFQLYLRFLASTLPAVRWHHQGA